MTAKRGTLRPAGTLNGIQIVSRDIRILPECEFEIYFELYALDKVCEGKQWERRN